MRLKERGEEVESEERVTLNWQINTKKIGKHSESWNRMTSNAQRASKLIINATGVKNLAIFVWKKLTLTRFHTGKHKPVHLDMSDMFFRTALNDLIRNVTR